MIKKDFVGRFSEITGENKKNSKDLVEAFLDLSADILAEDDNLQFVGWGGFVVKETPARRVKHPKTSENIIIPAKKVVKFKLGKNMEKALVESVQGAKDLETGETKFSINRVIKKISNIFSRV